MHAIDGALPNKRQMAMSLSNLVSEDGSGVQAEHPFTSGTTSADPSSPTSAVVPLSPNSYHSEGSRNKSLSFDDNTPSLWTNKDSKDIQMGLDRNEDGTRTVGSNMTKQVRKRQEPPELSELGIGQRASANLHAAYVSEQLKERTKAGLPTDGLLGAVALSDLNAKAKNSAKPKPQHACPEPDCDKSFSRLFNLRSHMRTHSKARPFVCESCNFAFSRRHDRDRHAKKHLSEKPYKCIVCEATFVRQDALVRHLRVDGIQNACMAAMEQRTLQLQGGDANSYMLAAKQQVHDEQQQEGKEIDMKSALQSALRGAEGVDMKGMMSDDLYNRDEANDIDDEDIDTEESDEADQPSDKVKRSESHPEDADMKDEALRLGSIKRERPSEKQIQTRPPSPHQEKNVGYESNKGAQPYSNRYSEKGYGLQDPYGEDRHGPMNTPRSIYPSPSRTHSRSHSQSQPYSVASDYHSHSSQHESAAFHPPPSSYHGSQSKYPPHASHTHPYREAPSNYGYSPSSSMSRYHERPPHDSRGYSSYGDHHDADHGGAYGSRDSAYERSSEGSHSGPQPWTATDGLEAPTDMNDEPDKTIFEAAMGLLRIRASQT